MKHKEEKVGLEVRENNEMKYHEDDRAQRFLNVFPLKEGQINISFINSTKHIVAWHKHEKQTDYWVCLKGSLKVGLATGNGSYNFEYLSDKNPRVLEIIPGVYHGYKALEPGSILAYYVTRKYDPTDEHRAEVGDFGENWDIENK
jgi:dTDP-4-dehydrorhamnose 3,5-epimerase-like enzyme